MNVKAPLLAACFFAFAAGSSAQVLISGYLVNPAGADSPYEYVQLVATQTIDFSATPYSVVVANNGTATSNGWTAGGSITYGFTISTGVVQRGSVFYVGGSGKLINGAGSTDISSANFLRTIDTGAAGGVGDGFGNNASGGVFGNGGSNADGIGIFNIPAASLTSTTVPVDEVFFGLLVGTAKPATGGYAVGANDHYQAGIFGDANNGYLFQDPGSAQYTSLSGTFDPSTGKFTVPRTGTLKNLTATSTQSDIASAITIAPEPSTCALLFAGALGLGAVVARRRQPAA